MQKGKLFVFEGPDGVGKSTTLQAVFMELRETTDLPWIKMRQPENFRHLIGQTNPDNWLKMLYYFMKDRELQLPIINNYLNGGNHVLLDRYYYSSMVYQSIAANIPMSSIYAGHCGVDPIIRTPDETFLLDAPDDVIEWRIENSPKKDLSNFDDRMVLQREIRKGYRSLAGLDCLRGEIITTVLTNKDIQKVVNEIVHKISLHII